VDGSGGDPAELSPNPCEEERRTCRITPNPWFDRQAEEAAEFSEAISFITSCETQAELNRCWDRLSEGGVPGWCGWLEHRCGVSWQIVPNAPGEPMGGPDRSARSTRCRRCCR
jgi:predicted 3-demethylubiquinone-9 3-methyltransferase (glyoxalase superfamily)